jgi:hypothetical protein
MPEPAAWLVLLLAALVLDAVFVIAHARKVRRRG